jgi:hypothetical protein
MFIYPQVVRIFRRTFFHWVIEEYSGPLNGVNMNISYEQILVFLEDQKNKVQLEKEKSELLLKNNEPILSTMDKVDLLTKLAYIRGRSEVAQELILFVDNEIDKE